MRATNTTFLCADLCISDSTKATYVLIERDAWHKKVIV